MKMTIYYSDNILEVTLKSIYTEKQILETLENSNILSLTTQDDKTLTLVVMNIVALIF